MTQEEINKLVSYEEASIQLGFVKEDKTADLEALKRFIRKYDFPFVPLGDEKSRNRMIRQLDINDYIKNPQKFISIGEQNTEQGNNEDVAPSDNTPEGVQRKIELVAKKNELYIKEREFETSKAGFPTLADYKLSVDEFIKNKTALDFKEKELVEREQAARTFEGNLIEREQALQQRLDGIENERNQILTEARKQADELLARTKVEVKTQEISEDEDMKWAFDEFYKIIYAMNEWGFHDYSNPLQGRLEYIIDNFNNNKATLKDLTGDFKYCSNIVSNLMEYTQTLKRNAHQFVELRNELGGILNGIQIRLHLDDERRGHNLTPALPSD